jgi:hypothetical protein
MLASKGEGSQAQILHLIPIQWRLRPSDLQSDIRQSGIVVAARNAWYLCAVDPLQTSTYGQGLVRSCMKA